MRTELTSSQTSIIALATQLTSEHAPGSELRLESKGRLYAKSGNRHADGKSKSRLAYQARGAAFLHSAVCMSLRARDVHHVTMTARNIMDVVRPPHERPTYEPDRYQVRHGRDMAQIIQLADALAASGGLPFTQALEQVIKGWPHLSRLDAQERLALLQKPLAAVDEPLGLQPLERKDGFDMRRLPLPSAVSEQPLSAARAERQEQVQWHEPALVFNNHTVGPHFDGAERKHGPGRSEVEATPARASSGVVVIHGSPDNKRIADRAARRFDDILRGDVGADHLVEQVGRDEAPHLISLMQKKANALLAAQETVRDEKARLTDQEAWRHLGRFCGQACIDDGMGTHAFTRAHVVKFPLVQRLNMLAALADGQLPRPGQARSDSVVDSTQSLSTIQQTLGLSSAFRDQELLPPTDELKAKAMGAKLQAIGATNPGAPFGPDLANAVIKAHHDAYQLNGKPLAVVPSAGLKAPFALSKDRSTLRVSSAPRPAGEMPGDVVRRLVGELNRTYQQQLVDRMYSGDLPQTDDRFALAVILHTCRTQPTDVELLASSQRQMPAGAYSRHLQLHATHTFRD